MAAIVPVVLDGALPTDPAGRASAVTDTVANVARAVSGLAPAAQNELAELFSLLSLPPTRIALAGVKTPWEDASPKPSPHSSTAGGRAAGRFCARLMMHCTSSFSPRGTAIRGRGLPSGIRGRRPSEMSDRAATTLFRSLPRTTSLAAGNVIDASTLERDLTLEADVVIVGTGAGGGIAAETSAMPGSASILVEEGPLRTARDFHMREAEAYPDLYQESAARKTKDKAINILQGRCVGGGTTVNWTSSFRTPPATLAYWAHALRLDGYSADDARALVRARRGAAVDRAVGRWRRTRTTTRWPAARRTRDPVRDDPAQRQGLLAISAIAAWAARSTRSSRCW